MDWTGEDVPASPARASGSSSGTDSAEGCHAVA
jgi:hypothetical protein